MPMWLSIFPPDIGHKASGHKIGCLHNPAGNEGLGVGVGWGRGVGKRAGFNFNGSTQYPCFYVLPKDGFRKRAKLRDDCKLAFARHTAERSGALQRVVLLIFVLLKISRAVGLKLATKDAEDVRIRAVHG